MKQAIEWINEVGEACAKAMFAGSKPPGVEVEKVVEAIQNDARTAANQQLADLRKRADEAESALYMPGDYRCPKCGFVCHKRILHAADGSVSADAREHYEICPNDLTKMDRITWQQGSEENCEFAKRLMRDVDDLRAKLTAVEAERDGIATQRDEMAHDLKTLRGVLGCDGSDLAQLICAIDTLRSDLQREKGMLDWLDQQDGGIGDVGYGNYNHYFGGSFPKARQVITAAMEGGKG